MPDRCIRHSTGSSSAACCAPHGQSRIPAETPRSTHSPRQAGSISSRSGRAGSAAPARSPPSFARPDPMLTRARLWLRSLFLRRRLEVEMQREIDEHIDRATDRLMARGLTMHDARNAATREFGNVTYHKEEARRARGTHWLEALAADSRFALRHFMRHPGATL